VLLAVVRGADEEDAAHAESDGVRAEAEPAENAPAAGAVAGREAA